MTTYQKWLAKFNEGGHESFEEFICNELDYLVDPDDPELPGNEPPQAIDEDEYIAPSPQELRPGFNFDEPTLPTDPNAGSSSNT